MRVRLLVSLALPLAFLGALLVPARALAHAGHGPATLQTFTQTVGPYDLAVTVELPPSVPSTLYLTTVPQADIGDATISFRAVPRGQSFDGAPTAQIQGVPGTPSTYYSELPVDRAGDWDIEVRAQGAKGSGAALIPLTIVVQPLPAGSIGLFASLGGLVVLMLASIALAVIFQRRQLPVPGWANWVLGQGMFACVVLAVVFGIQQFTAQAQSAQAAANPLPTAGRPHANMALHTEPAAPTSGQPLTLTLDLSDGSTGLPVDDIVPHHDALIHLVVISADGADFHHLHPPRVAPGRYVIALTPDRPGRYTAYAEIQRQDSGTQVIARDFDVGGATGGAAPPAAPGLGAREVAGMQVSVTSSLAPLRAGKQTTLTFRFSENGQPVLDLQAWLGMAGHLIARSADGAIFAHVHAAERTPPSEPILAAGTVYGPEIRFVYTFPQAGRYQVWAQFQRGGQIITVPLVVEVT